MLWGDLELPRNVIPHQLSEKAVVLIVHQIIKTDSRTYKDFFDLGQLFDLLDQLDVLLMIRLQIFAWRWRKTLSVRANAAFKLFIAGRIAEIRCRTANVVDVTLEIRHLSYDLSLANDALDAS